MYEFIICKLHRVDEDGKEERNKKERKRRGNLYGEKWKHFTGRAYVICGPVLDESADRYATIGASKVVIPRYFYKIVLLPVYEGKDDFATPDDCTKLIARAYLIPNKQCNDSYEAYRVSINEIESRTGIDFFYLLDDSIEEKIESKASD